MYSTPFSDLVVEIGPGKGALTLPLARSVNRVVAIEKDEQLIDFLNNKYTIPDNVCLADAGTGIRRILFTLSLSEIQPKVIVIIDAVDKGKKPGEIFDISLDEIPAEKIDDSY